MLNFLWCENCNYTGVLKNMKFSEAFELMKQGHKLKLPSWGGYWYWDGKNQTIMMKCRAVDSDTGKELLDIRETQRVEYTLKNIMSDDWVLATNENCTMLGGQPVFGFDEAIKYIKRGLKLRRKAWECKEQYVQLTKNVSDILDGRVIYNN